MIKKILIALMVLVVALAVVACGGPAVDETLGGNNGDQTNPPEEHVHAYEEEITPATCTAVGKVVTKCACGDVQSEEELPLAEHTQSVVDCEKDTVCTVCGAVLAEKTGHTVTATEIVTAATCASAGKEKGTCVTCAKVIETEIPATGHIASSSITMVDGSFKSTCSVCNQAVTLKAETPVFALDFEEDIATQAAKYDIGLSVYKPQEWKIEEVNGSKSFKLDVGKPYYIDIVDPTKLSALGTFVISFDYTTTQEAAAGSAASVISILNNFQGGKQTSAGATGWGWMIKLVEDKKVLATVKDADKVTSSNSVAVERNVKYNVQIVISPATKETHTFINGTYIGTSNQAITVSDIAPANAAIRFGDGPNCGHVVDNFQISPLK